LTSAANDEEKYVLDYYTEGERAEDEPPFKYRSFYLDDAVAEAWRIARAGGDALRITRGGEPVFEATELGGLLEKMSELEGGRNERERAAHALGGTNDSQRREGDDAPKTNAASASESASSSAETRASTDGSRSNASDEIESPS